MNLELRLGGRSGQGDGVGIGKRKRAQSFRDGFVDRRKRKFGKMVNEGNGVVERGQMRSHRAGCTFLRVCYLC